MNYKDEVQKFNILLNKNTGWGARFADYAKKILENQDKYKKGCKQFRVRKPLTVYTSVGLAKEPRLKYDLRFAGQSVATINVKDERVTISTKDGPNKDYFGINETLKSIDWNSPGASHFRAAFTEKLREKNKGKSREHLLENFLLNEFGKNASSTKKLCNIQPVRLSGAFFQMLTPFAASTDDVTYANADGGGGIDILARIRHRNGEVRLCVMELKDENHSAKAPAKAMKQALAYATFLARLLNSQSGEQWYKIYGFKGKMPQSITIHVVALMPKGAGEENFETEPEIQVGKTTQLKLCSLYFDEKGGKYNFSGSLVDEIRIHKGKTG
jgi:hypothetical protein